MFKCYVCKNNVKRVRYFTYMKDIEFEICHACWEDIQNKNKDDSKTQRETFLEYLGLPEQDAKILEQERNKRLYEEFGVLGHDRPKFKQIGECSCCHKTGPLWLRSMFLDYEDNEFKDINLCCPCTARYNLEQSALLKSFIKD